MTYVFRSPRRAVVAAAALGIATLVACTDANQSPKVPLSKMGTTAGAAAADPAQMSDIERVALDSGNAFYRAKKYVDALAQYRLAARHAPNEGAPYFGIYMVARVMNNVALADSAVAAMKARGMEAPGGPHNK